MAEYTTTSLITIAPFNNPLRHADIDEYSWNIAPDHHIRVLKTVDASNAAIDDAERDEICWGYRYSRGIGLDIEYTRMADEAFADVNPSTIQVSYSHVTLIFQMRFFQGMLPENLRAVLESPDILKVGVGIEQDAKMLARRYGVDIYGLVELSHMAWRVINRELPRSAATPPSLSSLKLLTDILTPIRLHKSPKNAAIPDWNVEKLDADMISYAALDSFCGFRVYEAMQDKAIAMECEAEAFNWTFCVRIGGDGTAKAFSADGEVWKPKDPRDPLDVEALKTTHVKELRGLQKRITTLEQRLARVAST